ncbi:MAG: hypothetical protein J7598_07455 [Mitsuaria chitosanitabida]|uniref:hypothetical protein n=1 Tax=Roseateles chitosanitabidus TaxID=65048 RepID=UPI001B2E6A23|nr:hypothetical protein [Roseateles chitosanitabidus]MBO9686433.1 hypothetical protein [Roseateles chitosanitabidus]
MDIKLSQALHGRGRSHAPPVRNEERALHRFSDGALHSALMAAVILVAVLAVVQALRVGTLMWQLEPVVIQGKSQNVPLPAAPQPLESAQPGR